MQSTTRSASIAYEIEPSKTWAPRDAALAAEQRLDGHALLDADVGQRLDPLTNDLLDERAAGGDDLALDEAAGPVAAGLEPAALVELDQGGAPADQVLHDPGEHLGDGPGAAGQQGVGVPALGDATAGAGRGGQLVALEDGDLLEVIGQRAGGGEAGDPGADDDGVAAER